MYLQDGEVITPEHPYAQTAKVFLDGKEVKMCVEALAGEDGYVTVLAMPLEVRGEHLRTKTLYGDVKVEIETGDKYE